MAGYCVPHACAGSDIEVVNKNLYRERCRREARYCIGLCGRFRGSAGVTAAAKLCINLSRKLSHAAVKPVARTTLIRKPTMNGQNALGCN